jgi:hypothetical protein
MKIFDDLAKVKYIAVCNHLNPGRWRNQNMRNMESALFGGIVLMALGFAPDTQACTTEGWPGPNSGIGANANPASPPTVARYSELCALAVTNTSHVQDDNASDTRYRARFYVLDGLTGADPIDIFVAYSNEGATTTLFKVAFNGSQFTFNATGAGGGSASAASVNGWNLVEFDWDSGSNTFDYWVNADATTAPDNPTGSVNAGTGTVEAVRLGAPNGFAPQSGKITFDAFESHRTTAVGALLVGDANASGTVSGLDLVRIQNEILQVNLASGQPDCNKNGAVSGIDLVCVQNIILGN